MSVQKSANISNKELVNLILYGLKENNIDIEEIDSFLIETIIDDNNDVMISFKILKKRRGIFKFLRKK